MGSVNVFARRRKDGTVEYGWNGNWGDYWYVGRALMDWYSSEYMVDYLFGLGQCANLNEPLSETRGDCGTKYRTCPTGNPYWTTNTEREIFSRSCLADAAYFYDTDGHWYYIHPWPVCIKIPLELVVRNLNSVGTEQWYTRDIERVVAERILTEQPKRDPKFAELFERDMSEKCLQEQEWTLDRDKMIEAILESRHPMERLAKDFGDLLDYFDDWFVIVPDEEYKEVKDILLREAAQGREETIRWEGHPQNPPAPYMNPDIEDFCGGYVSARIQVLIKLYDRSCQEGLFKSMSAEELADLRGELDPRQVAPEWFIAEFRKKATTDQEAVDLVDKYKEQLLRESKEFSDAYEEARKSGEDRYLRRFKNNQ